MKILKRAIYARALALAACTAMACGLAGCGSAETKSTTDSSAVKTVLKMPDLKGQTIVVNTYGGTLGEAVLKEVAKPFEAATGAKVTVSTSCCDSFTTQVKGNQFAGDVLFLSNFGDIQAYGAEGLLNKEPRLAEIAKARGVDPAFSKDNVIAGNFFAYVLAWNTEKAKDHPTSWEDFYDTSKFTGTRNLPAWAQGSIEAANMASGTPASDAYPVDTDKAISKLTQLRKDANVKFYKTSADSINQLATGEAEYGLASSNRVAAAIRQGLPLDMTFNQAVLVPLGVAIPKTAKNVDAAVAFVDFYMQPEIQTAFAASSGLAPGYADAAAAIDPSLKKYMVTAPENLKLVAKDDDDWWLKNTASVDATFAKWLNGS